MAIVLYYDWAKTQVSIWIRFEVWGPNMWMQPTVSQEELLQESFFQELVLGVLFLERFSKTWNHTLLNHSWKVRPERVLERVPRGTHTRTPRNINAVVKLFPTEYCVLFLFSIDDFVCFILILMIISIDKYVSYKHLLRRSVNSSNRIIRYELDS